MGSILQIKNLDSIAPLMEREGFAVEKRASLENATITKTLKPSSQFAAVRQ